MPYSPTTWIEGVTKLGPTDMNKLELGVQATAVVADAAIPKPNAPATNSGLVWNGSNWVAAALVNANVDPAAAIAYSKLNLAGSIINNDIASAAAIALSKLAGYPTDATKFARGDGTWAVPVTAMTQICDLTLGASQASFDTNTILGGNIPATYNHLKIVAYVRTDVAVVHGGGNLRFNNDSAGNYDNQGIQANGATVAGFESFANTVLAVTSCPGASATANSFGSLEFLIPHYANALNNKTAVVTYASKGGTTTGTIRQGTGTGSWRSNAAITRITLLPDAGNFVSGSRFTLYGMI